MPVPASPSPTSSRAEEPAVPVGESSTLRIALFTGNYNHIEDGVSRTLNRLVRFLLDHGHKVLIFGPTVSPPPMEHAGQLVPVRSVPVPGRPEYRASLVGPTLPGNVQHALRTFGPDLLHVATPDLLGRAALRWGREASLPVVATYHTHFPSYLDFYHAGALVPLLWRYLRRFYDACNEVYVPTPTLIETLRENGITAPLRLWPRGVETSRFSPAHRSSSWRCHNGFDENDVIVLFVSRLVKEKGLDVFASVIHLLTHRGLPVRALVVGDGPEREDFEKMLPEAVFTGYLEGDALSKAYASSDLFLFPSETETFGNVTLEAMASGLPVVCADAAGSRSLVEDGITGMLCSPRDRDAFAEAAERLILSSGVRSEIARRAREAALSYSWSEVLGRMETYYQRLAHSGVSTS